MSFELSKQVRGVLEVGSTAVGAEVLRSQVARFAMLQLQPIIEKFQSQGTQVVLEKIHEAGKSFWWDIALHMSKEISLESVHLAELGAVLAVPLIARMSEYRVMKDVKNCLFSSKNCTDFNRRYSHLFRTCEHDSELSSSISNSSITCGCGSVHRWNIDRRRISLEFVRDYWYSHDEKCREESG